MEVKKVTQSEVSQVLPKVKKENTEEIIELDFKSSQVSSETEDYPGLKISHDTKTEKKADEPVSKIPPQKTLSKKSSSKKVSLISRGDISSLARLLHNRSEKKQEETQISQNVNTSFQDKSVAVLQKTSSASSAEKNSDVYIEDKQTLATPEFKTDEMQKYLEYSNTLDEFLVEHNIIPSSLTFEERARILLIIGKRAVGELTQSEYKDERLIFETEKVQADAREIITPDKKSLTEDEKQQLGAAFAIASAIGSCMTLATAAGLSSEKEKNEFLLEYELEDMSEEQEAITEAVIEILPDILDEESVKAVLEATVLFSEHQIEEKKELLNNELSFLAEEEKAQILQKLNVQLEGIRIQNEIITINYIKETQNLVAEKFNGQIKRENTKEAEVKSEQKEDETDKDKIKNKYKKKIKLLETANEIIKKWEKDFENLPLNTSTKERQALMKKINYAKKFKNHLESTVKKLDFEIKSADKDIDNSFNNRMYILGKISLQCRTFQNFMNNPFLSNC